MKENQQLNIYVLSQKENVGYETCSSFAVCAYTQDEAKAYFPTDEKLGKTLKELVLDEYYMYSDKNLEYIKSLSNKELIELELASVDKKGLRWFLDDLGFTHLATRSWCLDPSKVECRKVGVAEPEMLQGEILCANK